MSADSEGEKKADARLLWRLLFLFKLAFLCWFLCRFRLLPSSFDKFLKMLRDSCFIWFFWCLLSTTRLSRPSILTHYSISYHVLFFFAFLLSCLAMPPFLSYYHPSWLGPVGTTSRSVLIKTLGLILPQAFSLLRMLRPPNILKNISKDLSIPLLML